jgi:uncharacterized protein YbbC (DUF1343 family)
MWEIIDNNGTIHSGSEEEMMEAFDAMTMDAQDFAREYQYASTLAKKIKAKYDCQWKGDLKLIEVHRVTK